MTIEGRQGDIEGRVNQGGEEDMPLEATVELCERLNLGENERPEMEISPEPGAQAANQTTWELVGRFLTEHPVNS